MKKLLLGVAIAAIAVAGIATWAYSADGQPATIVKMAGSADMASLRNAGERDQFSFTLSDAQIKTDWEVTCQAGQGGMFGTSFGSQAFGCATAGNGAVLANGKSFPRTTIGGGYETDDEGRADMKAASVAYLAVGRVPADQKTFSGMLEVRPELNAQDAKAMARGVIDSLVGAEPAKAELIDRRVDEVSFDRIFIPSAGMPSDAGCSWSGEMAYAYQTDAWYISVTGQCGSETYILKGNMPLRDGEEDGTTRYDLTVTLPDAGTTDDDALFQDSAGFGDDALFAAIDGVTGTITMTDDNFVEVTVDGVTEEVATRSEISAEFTGTSVPLHVVRSLVTLLVVIPAPNMFGA